MSRVIEALKPDGPISGGPTNPTAATEALRGLSVAEKNELLVQRGITFNDLPAWQKRGTGVIWRNVEVTGTNAQTGAPATTLRRRIRVEFELPAGEDYSALIRQAATGPI